MVLALLVYLGIAVMVALEDFVEHGDLCRHVLIAALLWPIGLVIFLCDYFYKLIKGIL